MVWCALDQLIVFLCRMSRSLSCMHLKIKQLFFHRQWLKLRCSITSSVLQVLTIENVCQMLLWNQGIEDFHLDVHLSLASYPAKIINYETFKCVCQWSYNHEICLSSHAWYSIIQELLLEHIKIYGRQSCRFSFFGHRACGHVALSNHY